MTSTDFDELIGSVQELISSAAQVISARQKVYEYLLSKPLDEGGAPSGHIGHRGVKKLITWKYRHGVAQYPRPLSERQIDQYGLRPLSKYDPYYVSWAVDNLYDDIVRFLIRKNMYVAPAKRGSILIAPSSLPGKKFQLQRLNILGKPEGNPVFVPRVMDAAEILWDAMSKEGKDEYLDSFEINL